MGQTDHLLLLCDVRSTYTHFQLIKADPVATTQERNKKPPGSVIVDCKLNHVLFHSFNDEVQKFLELANKEKGSSIGITQPIAVACVAVPSQGYHSLLDDQDQVAVRIGAQEDDLHSDDYQSEATCDWTLDRNELKRLFKIVSVVFVDAFLAVGYALLTLSRQETITLQDAPVVPTAPIALLRTDHGLEQCYLTHHDGEYKAWPSEGGHCEFAPKTELQVELLRYLKYRHNEHHRISVERVVGPQGLATVYDFLSEKYKSIRDNKIYTAICSSNDRHAAIAKYATTDRLCYKALEIFAWTYGSEAGCAALKWLPYGGLYVAGRFAHNQIQHLQSDTTFIDAYYDKGRVNPLMRQVPVKVITSRGLELRGMHYLAFKTLQHRCANESRGHFLIPRSLFYSVLCAVAAVAIGFAVSSEGGHTCLAWAHL